MDKTIWNIDFSNKQNNLKKESEPFIVLSNFQEPLLKELKINPTYNTVETFDSTNSYDDDAPYQTLIQQTNGNVVNSRGEPITFPGQKNSVDSTGSYSLISYNGNTYLNGYNCNDVGCDFNGVDIKINDNGSVYFRNGGDIMIDASTLNLSNIVFNGVPINDYLLKKKLTLKTGTKEGSSQPDPLKTVETTRNNPFTSDTLTTPVTSSNGATTTTQTSPKLGTNTMDLKGEDPSQNYEDFVTWWKDNMVPAIYNYNPIQLIYSELVSIYNLFIDSFGGDYPVNSYDSIFKNYLVFFYLIISISITYNLFYVLFYKENYERTAFLYIEWIFKIPGIQTLFGFVFGPLELFYSFIHKLMPNYVLEFFKRLENMNVILNNDSYKIIFVILYLFSICFVLFFMVPLYNCFFNSIRFGYDENGNQDTVCNYLIAIIVVYGIYLTIKKNFTKGIIPPVITIGSIVFIFLYFLILVLLSISIVWISELIICIIIICMTVFPWYIVYGGFDVINKINEYCDSGITIADREANDIAYQIIDNFNKTVVEKTGGFSGGNGGDGGDGQTNSQDTCQIQQKNHYLRDAIIFFYKYMFEIIFMVYFIYQICTNTYIIDNNYIYFKAGLYIGCIFCILVLLMVVYLRFFEKMKTDYFVIEGLKFLLLFFFISLIINNYSLLPMFFSHMYGYVYNYTINNSNIASSVV